MTWGSSEQVLLPAHPLSFFHGAPPLSKATTCPVKPASLSKSLGAEDGGMWSHSSR